MALLTIQHVNEMAHRLGVRIEKKAANDRNLKNLGKYIVANKMCGKFIYGTGEHSIAKRNGYSERECSLFEASRLDTGKRIGFILMAKKFRMQNHYRPNEISRSEVLNNPENNVSVLLDICTMKPPVRVNRRRSPDSDTDSEVNIDPFHQGVQGLGALLMCLTLTQMAEDGCVLFVSRKVIKLNLSPADIREMNAKEKANYNKQRALLTSKGKINMNRNFYSTFAGNALYDKFRFIILPGTNTQISRNGGATERFRSDRLTLQEAAEIMTPYYSRDPKEPRGQAAAAAPRNSRSRSQSSLQRSRRRSPQGPNASAAADPLPEGSPDRSYRRSSSVLSSSSSDNNSSKRQALIDQKRKSVSRSRSPQIQYEPRNRRTSRYGPKNRRTTQLIEQRQQQQRLPRRSRSVSSVSSSSANSPVFSLSSSRSRSPQIQYGPRNRRTTQLIEQRRQQQRLPRRSRSVSSSSMSSLSSRSSSSSSADSPVFSLSSSQSRSPSARQRSPSVQISGGSSGRRGSDGGASARGSNRGGGGSARGSDGGGSARGSDGGASARGSNRGASARGSNRGGGGSDRESARGSDGGASARGSAGNRGGNRGGRASVNGGGGDGGGSSSSSSSGPRQRSPYYCGMKNPPPDGQIFGDRLQCFRKGYGAGLGNSPRR